MGLGITDEARRCMSCDERNDRAGAICSSCAPTVYRMVQRTDGIGYRRATDGEIDRGIVAGRIRLAGADGDEQGESVTYWYDRA